MRHTRATTGISQPSKSSILLASDRVRRSQPGGWREVRGAQAVAEQTLTFAQFTAFGRPALVNGAAGIVAAQVGRPYSVMGFTVSEGRIVEIDILADPPRLRRLDLTGLDE